MTTTGTATLGSLSENPRWSKEARWRSTAQEIARDIFELKDILKVHGLSDDDWAAMERNPAFQSMLAESIREWRSSLNTRERIELQTLSMVEMALPEMFRALHDPVFSHASKVELFKTLARNVGIGVRESTMATNGERVSITINMGDDKKVEVRDVTPKVSSESEVEFALKGANHDQQARLSQDARGS